MNIHPFSLLLLICLSTQNGLFSMELKNTTEKDYVSLDINNSQNELPNQNGSLQELTTELKTLNQHIKNCSRNIADLNFTNEKYLRSIVITFFGLNCLTLGILLNLAVK